MFVFVNPNWLNELKLWALSIQQKNIKNRYNDDEEYFRYF